MMLWVTFVASCIAAFLLGGIPVGLMLGRAMGHVDVRTVGSGNVGSTNVIRTAGLKAGLITFALDIAKAAAAIGLGYLLIGMVGLAGDLSSIWLGGSRDWMMAVVYLCVVLGHMFSPFLGFKGGKGVAVTFGGIFTFNPLAGLLTLVPFIALVAPLRFVSLGSIVAAACFPVITWLVARPSPAFLATCAIIAALIIWAHRGNIKKLVAGTESRFSGHRETASEQVVLQGPTREGGDSQ